MKKTLLMALALMGSVAVNADEAVVAAAPAKEEVAAPALSADEQAFSAKLNEKNKDAFVAKLTAEQRKAVMGSVKGHTTADQAVEKAVR